jgi:hypothetical protein
MSASDKKKLRKELNAAAMTEKQQSEQKKQKSTKAATITFVVSMVLVVVLVLTSVLITPVKNGLMNNTIAAKVDGKELSATELNYFYRDSINNLVSQYSSYGDYAALYMQLYTGLNPGTPLDEQVKNKETNETWADHFLTAAVDNAKWVYTMTAEAEKAGHKLSEDEQKSIDTTMSYMSLYATLYGYKNTDGYVRAQYGSSASLESYKEYYTKCQLASSYAAKYMKDLKYTAEDFRKHEADKMNEFNSYSWASFYLKTSDYLTFLKLGTTTTGSDGKPTTTYSDEDNKKALEAAKADAEKLAAGTYEKTFDLDTAIETLAIFKDNKKTDKSTENLNVLHSSVKSATNEDMLKWLTNTDRKAGEVTMIPSTTKDKDGKETTNGYYILYFIGSRDNTEVNVGTVRHLLVAFEKDSKGNVTDAAKEAAKKEAEKLLKDFQDAGKLTEDDFAALIKKNSDDSPDGLYSDITPDSGYVKEFADWATAEHKAGDMEIVETEFGYHIMYYVSANDLNYRDFMIDNKLRSDAYKAWEEALLKAVTAEKLNTKYLETDLVIGG